jgi:hypothetical protein
LFNTLRGGGVGVIMCKLGLKKGKKHEFRGFQGDFHQKKDTGLGLCVLCNYLRKKKKLLD